MSSTKDSPALDLSGVSIEEEEEEDDNEIELSLDLSIGRGLRTSTKLQNSMEFVEHSSPELTDVTVVIPNKGDTNLPFTENLVGDLDGDPTGNSEVQAQRKRKREERLDEPQMLQCGVSETEIGVPEPNLVTNSSEMRIGSIERKSFKDGETSSRNNETSNPRPVILRSFSLNQSNRNLDELVTGTACSGKDSKETVVISLAEKTSMISSDIKPSVSQEADASKTETATDPTPRKPTSESTNPIVKGDENKAKNHTGQTNSLDTKPIKEPNSTSSGKVFKPPQIPCVSTTGNGPNGRKVTGFLYKYTNMEVSIVCVCHGSSFTPAEFVEHAGGMDISHPLRHIMVIPSAFE